MMDWNVIIVSVLGLFGTIASAYITNRINSKNQEKLLQLELEKQKLNNETELSKIKMKNNFEIQSEILNSDIKHKSVSFANYSYCASRLKYSAKFYYDVHFDYLKAYNQVCTVSDDKYTLECINKIHEYINKNRTGSLSYDEEFENLLNNLNQAFTLEIKLYKQQIKNIDTQE